MKKEIRGDREGEEKEREKEERTVIKREILFHCDFHVALYEW